MSRTSSEQVVHFLSDMYSVEAQALAQLVKAPEIAKDARLAEVFTQHHRETERQAERVRTRLEALGGSPSALKDAIMRIGGKGFLLLAQSMPNTPGRLVAHAYAYEAMEWAGYEVLIRLAQLAGDAETAKLGREIGGQERAMMARLEQRFDAAVEAAHRDTPPENLPDEVRKHLTEVHAFEAQSIALLKKSDDIAGGEELSLLYRQHLDQSRAHARRIDGRLTELGETTSLTKDAALALGGLNWGLFFQAQSDTPAKLAAFVYAFEHLEIAGYELLRRTAELAGDVQTARLCDGILEEERSFAHRVTEGFDGAAQATLEAVRA